MRCCTDFFDDFLLPDTIHDARHTDVGDSSVAANSCGTAIRSNRDAVIDCAMLDSVRDAGQQPSAIVPICPVLHPTEQTDGSDNDYTGSNADIIVTQQDDDNANAQSALRTQSSSTMDSEYQSPVLVLCAVS